MKFVDLIEKTAKLPSFTAGFLSAGGNPAQIRLQLNRWVNDGKLVRVVNGLYILGQPYRKIAAEPFCIANSMKKASYVSLHSALGYYGMIPEYVAMVSSVTTGRPQTYDTPLGRFDFRHISQKYFFGFRQIELASELTAFVAVPEKALLDLIYLTPGGEGVDFLEGMRLQNLELLDFDILREYVNRFNAPKLKRAFDNIELMLEKESGIEL